MKKVIKPLLLLFVLGLMVLGAYLFVNPKKALYVIIPGLDKVENIHVSLSGDTAFIEAGLLIQNKGLFKLHIDSVIYHVRLDTATLLSERRFLGIELNRSEADTLHLPVSLPFKRLIRKIRDLQGQDSMDVPIDVRLVYYTVVGRVTLPYSKTLRIEVPRPPTFDVEKIEYLRREKKTGYFMLHVKIHNYGKIKLNVSDLKYRFVAKELFAANGIEQEEIRVEPRSVLVVQLPVTVEFKSIWKTIGRVVRNDEVDYRLKLTAFFQNDKIGERKIPIEIEKSGHMALRK